MVTVECNAHPGAVVMLNGSPPGTLGSSARFTLNASEEHNESNFSCSAVLEVDGMKLYKNKTQKLLVRCEWGCGEVTPNHQGPAPKTS